MNEGGRVGERIAGPVHLDQAKRWMRSEKRSGRKSTFTRMVVEDVASNCGKKKNILMETWKRRCKPFIPEWI